MEINTHAAQNFKSTNSYNNLAPCKVYIYSQAQGLWQKDWLDSFNQWFEPDIFPEMPLS